MNKSANDIFLNQLSFENQNIKSIILLFILFNNIFLF